MGQHRFGYVGINTELGLTTNKTCRLRNVSQERLAQLIEENLDSLKEILQWNARHQIGLFRIGSGLIPFGSHDMNTLAWPIVFSDRLAEIGQWVEQHGMRLSTHPGQYVILNSLTPSVVQNAITDLMYHTTLMGTMGLDTSCKIVMHIGGLYGDKDASMQRFVRAYAHLPDAVKRRLVIENDDRLFNIWDVLRIADQTGIPVVFDHFHHEVNNTRTPEDQDIRGVMMRCFETWQPERDGVPKIHYSSQNPNGRPGSHGKGIDMEAFLRFFYQTADLDYDIVFESKDKEQTVLRMQSVLDPTHFSGLAYVS